MRYCGNLIEIIPFSYMYVCIEFCKIKYYFGSEIKFVFVRSFNFIIESYNG